MEKYLILGALALATGGGVWDALTGRIPNWLTYGGIVMAFLLRAWLGGWREMGGALLGGLLGGGVFLLFFLVRAMGAGDVKLMTALGCLAGVEQVVGILLASAIAGGFLAVGYMIYYRQAGRTLRNVGALARFHLASGVQPHPEINLSNAKALRIPYAVAIAVGTWCSLGVMLSGR